MKRKVGDIFRYIASTFATILTAIILLSIIIYVLSVGSKRLSWDLLVSDYSEKITTIKIDTPNQEYKNPNLEDVYFSKKFGIGLSDMITTEGNHAIKISYIDKNSPFSQAKNKQTGEIFSVEVNTRIDILMGLTEEGELVDASSKMSASEYVIILDEIFTITSLQCKTNAGGIRGSLLTTLLLILVTLVISLPLGVGAAIFLEEYAKNGKLKNILCTMIDMTSGIPSIIFGFCGAIIFIPFVSSIGGSDSYSVLAGALTMAIVLLPTIIKTTSESLRIIPIHYTMASLSLGASKTQTVFKIILPNAIPGILTAVLLSIGRIIGESAALIFVMGTSISDDVGLLKQSTSLSLHIWSITGGENPNYETACSISIIILVVVFFLSVLVKIISKKINKMEVSN